MARSTWSGPISPSRWRSAWAGGIGFWGAVAIAALGRDCLAWLLEMLVLRRLYQSPELFQLLATFGVVLIVQDAALGDLGTGGPAGAAGART